MKYLKDQPKRNQSNVEHVVKCCWRNYNSKTSD